MFLKNLNFVIINKNLTFSRNRSKSRTRSFSPASIKLKGPKSPPPPITSVKSKNITTYSSTTDELQDHHHKKLTTTSLGAEVRKVVGEKRKPAITAKQTESPVKKSKLDEQTTTITSSIEQQQVINDQITDSNPDVKKDEKQQQIKKSMMTLPALPLPEIDDTEEMDLSNENNSTNQFKTIENRTDNFPFMNNRQQRPIILQRRGELKREDWGERSVEMFERLEVKQNKIKN